MDIDRDLIWVKVIQGGTYWENTIATDDNDNIYITGDSPGGCTFDTITVSGGGFIAKYNQDGYVLWAKQEFRYLMMGYSEVEASASRFYNGNLFLSGFITNDTIIVGGHVFINPVGPPSYSVNSTYVASFSENGEYNWMVLLGWPASGGAYAMTIDSTGSIFIGGDLYGFAEFENDTLYSPGSSDGFFLKLNPDGEISWVKQLFSPIESSVNFIVPDNNQGFIVGCDFYDYCVLGMDTIESTTSHDIMLVHCDNDGNVIGYNHYAADGFFSNCCVDADGMFFTSGLFKDVLRIGENVFTSKGDYDIFIARISPATGIEEKKSYENSLIIYANPNEGTCKLELPDEFRSSRSLELSVFDNKGKLIQKARIDHVDNEISIDIRGEAKGMYNVILSNGEKSYSGKIVVK